MRHADPRIWDKLADLNWRLAALIAAVCCIGFALLYSVAGGSFSPWAGTQMSRFAIGAAVMLGAAMINIRTWMSLAYPAYAVSLALLAAVEFVGKTGKGAERWLELGPIQVQPSELMKIALILALARFLHTLTLDEISRPRALAAVAALIGAPAVLVLMQPNLGTAFILLAAGSGIMFAAGLSWRLIAPVVALALISAPLAWTFMHDYQRERVQTFLEPERDPLGAGYNILQSKIALGSGGLFGKGYLQGTQSRLNFLPEKQTDFIFTVLGEEFGLLGVLTLLGLYGAILATCFSIALQSRSHFGRLVATGVSLNFFLYIAINTSMSVGLIPVVGIPLPLVSYGGTALIAVMFGFGLVLSAQVHRAVEISRSAGEAW